jgi:aryl-alcohol dehydrogenase-like predicted oxidoreductase
MKYRKLGNTDLDVSLIALGTMTWGEQNTPKQAFEQMDYALDHGVNFFDVAEMYPVAPKPETQGLSEHYIGQWLAKTGNRDKIILATKVTGRGEANPGTAHIRGGPRLNRQQIHQAINDSLSRLKTDYVDLYQVHWPERSTNFFGELGYKHGKDDGVSIEETLSALNELVTQGKVRHLGISNETPWGVMEYLRLARENNWPRIASIQNPYNLLNRAADIGLAEIIIREKISMLAYSPLAFGMLSGKYIGGKKPAGSRLALFDRFIRYSNPFAQAATEAYAKLAQQHQLAADQMALAFVNGQQYMTSNIIGATTIEQLQRNIASIDVTLSEEILVAIENIHHRYRIPSP